VVVSKVIDAPKWPVIQIFPFISVEIP